MSAEIHQEARLKAGSPSPGTRFPALDGLRAFAVLAVMLFHTSSSPLAGGFLGVDVFFVLSGFLITGMLLTEHRMSGRISLTGFWLRRARRLAPPLLLLLFALALARLAVPQAEAATWRVDILSALTYTTNWFQILTGGDYFAQFGVFSPLTHTWSLAIEEQFYIGFALLFALIGVRWTRRRFGALVAALLVISAASMALGAVLGASSWAYYGTVPRVQALLVGVLLALLMSNGGTRSEGRRGPSPAALGGFALAILSVVFVLGPTPEVMFRGGFLLVALAAALLIVGVLGSPTLAAVFSWRPLVWLGLISYGVYLWHWPVFMWLQFTQADPGWPTQIWSMVVTVLLAACSYLVVERPVRFGRFASMASRKQWLAYLVAAAAIVGLVLLPARHLPDPDDLPWPAADRVPADIFVGGDSTLLSLAVAFPNDLFPQTTVAGETPMGCGIVDVPFVQEGAVIDQERCAGWQERWKAAVGGQEPEVAVVASGVWDLFDRAVAGGSAQPGQPGFDEPFIAAFRDAIAIAGENGRVPVFVLGVPCMASLNDKEVLNDRARVTAANTLIQSAVSGMPKAHYVDMAQLTCLPDGTALVKDEGRVLRDDGVHWTPAGARVVWARILQQIAEVDRA